MKLIYEIPACDRLDEPDGADWSPPPSRYTRRRVLSVVPEAGPTDEDKDKRIAAWTSPAAWHPDPANDNADWPLAKFLRTEKRFAALMLAERYRALFDAAANDVLLAGRDPSEDIFAAGLNVVHRVELDESTGALTSKGVRKSMAKGNGDEQAVSAATAGQEARPRAKPVAKPWSGDAALLSRIDAIRELAVLRGKLGPVLDCFEMAVVDGLTLQQLGILRGLRGKGAVGAGRAIVDMGLEICEQHWRMAWPKQLAA